MAHLSLEALIHSHRLLPAFSLPSAHQPKGLTEFQEAAVTVRGSITVERSLSFLMTPLSFGVVTLLLTPNPNWNTTKRIQLAAMTTEGPYAGGSALSIFSILSAAWRKASQGLVRTRADERRFIGEKAGIT